MHLDGLGNVIHGRPLHVTVLTPFALGAGQVAMPGQVFLMEEGTAYSRIHSKAARESTPEEIALFVAEREMEAAALADARSEVSEASRHAAEQAIEAEIHRRVAERLSEVKEELVNRFEGEATKAVLEEVLGNAIAREAQEEEEPAADLSTGITHGDPAASNRDPKAGGARRGGRSS